MIIRCGSYMILNNVYFSTATCSYPRKEEFIKIFEGIIRNRNHAFNRNRFMFGKLFTPECDLNLMNNHG